MCKLLTAFIFVLVFVMFFAVVLIQNPSASLRINQANTSTTLSTGRSRHILVSLNSTETKSKSGYFLVVIRLVLWYLNAIVTTNCVPFILP